MTYSLCKQQVLFRYHKNIDFWHTLVGRMFENTDGFSKSGSMMCQLDGRKVCLSFDVNTSEWNIEQTEVKRGIKFIRRYLLTNNSSTYWYDVCYHSNRLVSYTEEDLPSTAKAFVRDATSIIDGYDKIYHRAERVYSMD